MKKSPKSQSGIFNPRILTATVLSIVGVSLAMLSFNAAASGRKTTSKQQTAAPAAGPAPPGATLSTSNRTFTYTDPVGPAPNATGEGVGFSKPTCAANG